MAVETNRFVALDIHKTYLVVGAVNAEQEVVWPARRLAWEDFPEWAARHLRQTDAVVFEVSTNAWWVYDQVVPLVGRVLVAHPYHVKLIAAARVKTDKRDTFTLARLLAANLIPTVWVPPEPVRQLRALVAHRERLVSQRSAAKNRLQSVCQRHGLPPPAGVLSPAQMDTWLSELPLPGTEKLHLRHEGRQIIHLSDLIEEVERELADVSVREAWRANVAYLVQLPGIGMLTAMTLLAAIGDITRFPTAKKLVGYAGLGARIHASGQTRRTGSLTKEGRRELRKVMVESAWIAVRHAPRWRTQFERLASRVGRQKAIVAVARKQLVVVWYVLTARQADRQAEPEPVARSLFTWGMRYGVSGHLGLTRGEFVRQELDRLGLAPDLQELRIGSEVIRLKPAV